MAASFWTKCLSCLAVSKFSLCKGMLLFLLSVLYVTRDACTVEHFIFSRILYFVHADVIKEDTACWKAFGKYEGCDLTSPSFQLFYYKYGYFLLSFIYNLFVF